MSIQKKSPQLNAELVNEEYSDFVENEGYEQSKRKYNQVDLNLRQELLTIIRERSLSIKSASEELGINYSTAKNIVRIYRRENRMNKLPKRVSKALEDVLKEIKIPDKKIDRFIARNCPLSKSSEGIPVYNNLNNDIEDNQKNFKAEKTSSRQIELYNSQPVFNSSCYKDRISQNWDKGKSVVSSCGSKMTYYNSLCS